MVSKLSLSAALLWLLSCVASSDVILKPITKGDEVVAVIFIQGFFIRPEQYVPLLAAVQKASHFSLWVGIPEFTLDVPEPLELSSGIDRVLGNMHKEGMNATQLFFAGHSLGGGLVQDYVHGNHSDAAGQVLMGSFLLRKYQNRKYPVPTLTIGGELDGLARVSRMMESIYYSQGVLDKFPVAVVRGMSHMQFASGDPPVVIKERDLIPEIAEEEAHDVVARLTADFIDMRVKGSSMSAFLAGYVDASITFVQPLLKAYALGGSHVFKPPCNDDPPGPDCTTGNPWTERAQQIMGGLPVAQVTDQDSFHPVWQIPVHLPKVLSNCTAYSPSCVVRTTTVSQNVYEALDSLDTAFFPTSATEIRAKMLSRQSILRAAGKGTLDFNSTDGSSLCKVINQAAYDWAVKNCGNDTLERFKRLGEPMVMGDDMGPYNIGPVWIWDPLHYKHTADSEENKILEVRSVMMRTPVDFSIPLSAGFHYCKLLSPARAMEWLYVDGLRMHDSLNNSTELTNH